MLDSRYFLGAWIAAFSCSLQLPEVALGQVIPDGTPDTGIAPDPGPCATTCSIITSDQGNTATTNLFHSFEQFSIPTDGSVTFEQAPSISNILVRVTGEDTSTIDGFIRATSDANLFLMNPNGILFGPSGGIDIGGSFVATTAEAIEFSDQGQFSTIDTASDLTLLTVDPTAFLFGQAAPQPIISQSTAPDPAQPFAVGGLTVKEGRSLLLVGGDIRLATADSRERDTELQAPGGRIELGGLGGPGVVELNIRNNELSLSYEDNALLSDVSISNSGINVSGRSDGNNSAGEVVIVADNVSISNSRIESETFGIEDAGNVFIRANNSVELQASTISSSTFDAGEGGNIELVASTIEMGSGSSLAVFTRSRGDAGGIFVNAEIITLEETSTFDSAASLNEETSSEATGRPGEIQIQTNSLSLSDGSAISTVTANRAVDSGASTQLSIEARNDISLTTGSSITSETRGERDASNIQLNATSISLNDSSVSASTSGEGDAGSISISNAETVTLDGKSNLSARSTGAGSAGNLSVQTSGQFTVQNGSQVQVSGEDAGDSGMLNVAAGTVVLNNGRLLASVEAGEDGNIELNIEDVLVLRGDSLISATAVNDANGGNVDIVVPFIIALSPDGDDGNDIRANAMDGDGGRIAIEANTLFGIEENRAMPGNMSNDIDASSEAGIDGEVIITTLEVDPDQGTDPLPSGLAVPDISQGCQISNSGQFIATGQGGLSSNPYEPLSSEGIQEDIYPAGYRASQLADESTEHQHSSETLVEAQGWERNSQGDIVLLAESSASQDTCQRTLTQTF